MDQKTLLEFIQRIVRSGNSRQSRLALEQLANILDLHGESSNRRLVLEVQDGLQDLQALPPDRQIDENEIRIARERAIERRRREEEARNIGRC